MWRNRSYSFAALLDYDVLYEYKQREVLSSSVVLWLVIVYAHDFVMSLTFVKFIAKSLAYMITHHMQTFLSHVELRVLSSIGF